MASVVKRLYEKRRVLRIMVQRDLKVRYAQSFLGYLWTILDPLLMSMIYFVVFALIFQRAGVGYEPYFLFLLAGLLPWQWFNGGVMEGSRALLSEAKLVRSAKLPRELWVLRVIIAKGIEFVLSMPVLLAFVVIYMIRGETELNWRLVLIPVGMALQFVLLLGIALMLAPIVVLINDMRQVIRIGLRMAFYATPIIYVTSQAPGWLAKVLWFNPMAGVLEFYRAGFFDQPLAWQGIVSSVIMSLGLFFIGRLVFKRLEPTVLKEI